MAWIKVIDEKEATGNLREIYDEIKSSRGKIANILKIHSLNPQSMKDHMNLYLTIMFGPSGLSREEREMIAVVVSSINRCDYCLNHHAEALNFYWKDTEKLEKFKKDFTQVGLSQRHKRMLEYAVKLTKEPYNMEEHDVELLRKAGFNDEDILNINLITSYFNFVNRIALGLGVEFSEEEIKGYKY